LIDYRTEGERMNRQKIRCDFLCFAQTMCVCQSNSLLFLSMESILYFKHQRIRCDSRAHSHDKESQLIGLHVVITRHEIQSDKLEEDLAFSRTTTTTN